MEIPTAIDLGTMQDAEAYGQHSIANVTERVVNRQDVSMLRIFPKLPYGQLAYVGEHCCDRTPTCYQNHSHMWFYGGWCLRRPDKTTVRSTTGSRSRD